MRKQLFILWSRYMLWAQKRMRTKAIRYAQKSIKYNDLAIAYDKTIARVISKALNPDYGIDFADDYPIGEA